MKFLPGFGAALRAGLRWRLILLWILVTSVSTACLALPIGQLLANAMDHSVHASEWAQRLDVLMIFDMGYAQQNVMPAIAGAGESAALVLFILLPFLNGAFIASSRAVSPIKLGELIRESLRQYWPMFRMMFMALIPLAIAGVVEWATMKGVKHYGVHAILASDVNHLKWAAVVASLIVFAWASASVDAGRAFLALNPNKRSAIKAWWRGLKLVVVHPLRSLVLYVAVTAIAAILLALVAAFRLHMSATSFWGFLFALLITQLLVAVTAWMHYARQFGMLELARALQSASAAETSAAKA